MSCTFPVGTNVQEMPFLVQCDFLQNSSELNENNLQDQIFSYMLQKYILHHQANLSTPNASLSEFRLFLEENN